jgi:circadian clock protein KaiB
MVDVFREPKKTLAEGLFVTPTLIKFVPSPLGRITSTLNQTQIVLDALELKAGQL